MQKAVAIIPARYDSTRFPGKPLASLLGRAMLEHVYRRTALATVYVVVTGVISLAAIALSALAITTVLATAAIGLSLFFAAFALACLIVWLVSWLAGDETDVLGMMLDAMTKVIVNYKPYTRVTGLYYEGLESDISSGGTLLEGATLTLSDEFTGSIVRRRGDGDSQLNQSDIYAWLQASPISMEGWESLSGFGSNFTQSEIFAWMQANVTSGSSGSISFITRQGNSRCQSFF